MNIFDERQDRFEKEFAHSKELQFKVNVRRDKLVGLWAAELMGLEGEAAQDYAKDLIMADLDEPGDEDVVRKLQADFAAKNVDVDVAKIRAVMEEQAAIARQQITNE